MKTVIILCGSFPPTNIVGSLRPYRLTRQLLAEGWQVIVLTHPPQSGWDLDDSLLQELQGHFELHYVSKQPQVKFWSAGLAARVAGTARDFARRWVKPDLEVLRVSAFCKAFQEIAGKNEIDLLLTTSPPHSIHLAGLRIHKKYRLPWIVDYRDPWEYYPETGHLKINNPLERYWESRVAHGADALISTTRTYTENLKQRHSDLAEDHFHTLTNTFDRRKTSRHFPKSTDKFVICYTGIFYPAKDPYGFFRALRTWFDKMDSSELANYRDRLEVHLIGSRNKETREVIENLGLEENVLFFDRMPHDKAVEKTLGADMLLISSGLGGRTRPGWLPSKLFEYLGCRIPILALIREGEMAQILRETNSGYVVTEENHDLIATILQKEIAHKFTAGAEVNPPEFTFNGIERFEEETVMSAFASICEKQRRKNVANIASRA